MMDPGQMAPGGFDPNTGFDPNAPFDPNAWSPEPDPNAWSADARLGRTTGSARADGVNRVGSRSQHQSRVAPPADAAPVRRNR